jgi:chitin disaccharide deacetylase
MNACARTIGTIGCCLGLFWTNFARAQDTAATGAADSVPKAKRSLIVHADDAGMSHSVNLATIEAMEKGIVTSTSILVPCPWFGEFAAYARNHPERDYGIHLTLTSEWELYRWGPVAPRDQVPSLVDKDGYLWRDNDPVDAHVKLNEAEIELRAQIERARQFGVPLSHLDTHMGTLLSRPDLLELYVNLALEYKLPIMFTRQATDPRMQVAYPALRGRGQQLLDALDRHHLPVLSSVLMLYQSGDHEARKRRYLSAFEILPPGVNEVIVHCGIDNAELSAITSSSTLRDSDRRLVTDPDVKANLDRLGITLTNWKQFQAETAAR